jgi:O-antigen ligase
VLPFFFYWFSESVALTEHGSLPDEPHGGPVRDIWIFRALLVLLFWAPLPLGSNRIWAIGLLFAGALALVIASVVAWRHALDEAARRIARFAVPLTLIAIMVLFAVAQTLPWPADWIAAVSPEAARVQEGSAASYLSLDVYQTRVVATLAFTYFCAFLVAVLSIRSFRRLDALARLFVWSGVFQAALGSVLFSLGAHYWIFHFEMNHSRLFGTYGYYNSTAGYLVMCLSIGIGLMLARLGRGSHWPADWKHRLRAVFTFILSPKMRLRILLVVMVIGLVLTRSRMGNASFFIALLVVGLFTIVVSRKSAPTTVALIASLVIIDVVIVGSWVGIERVVQRLEDTEMTVGAGGREESVEARTESGRVAMAIVDAFPWTGTGGGGFYASFLRYRTPRVGYIDHAHNDYVEITTDYGWPGLAVLGSLAALTLGQALAVLVRRRANLPRGIAFGAAMSIVALLIHSAVDFNLQIPANALTMTVILAMVWIARELPSPSGSESAGREAA